MNRGVALALVLTAGVAAALGWFGHRAAAPAITVEAVVSDARPAPPAEPLDQYPLVGEEDDELEGLLVEGESLPGPPETMRGDRRMRAAAGAWRELAPLAEQGDARAAMQLFLALDACRRVLAPTPRELRQRERLATAIEQVPVDRRRRALEGYARLEANCADADPAWLETGLDWLTQAADGGQVAAKLMWASRAGAYLDLENADAATRDWHARMATRYLNEAVATGSAQAMMMVARRDAETDPVNALAHAAVAARVVDERSRAAALARGPSDSPRRDRYLLRQQQQLDGIMFTASERLTNAQIAAAHRRADELYERCCRS